MNKLVNDQRPTETTDRRQTAHDLDVFEDGLVGLIRIRGTYAKRPAGGREARERVRGACL
jgi:hypothetical protein